MFPSCSLVEHRLGILSQDHISGVEPRALVLRPRRDERLPLRSVMTVMTMGFMNCYERCCLKACGGVAPLRPWWSGPLGPVRLLLGSSLTLSAVTDAWRITGPLGTLSTEAYVGMAAGNPP